MKLNQMRRTIKLFPLLLLLVSGCSSNKPDEPKEITETKKDQESDVSVDTPEEELFKQGKRIYQAGLFSIARESFETLRSGYPLSPYVEFAEVKVADCHFEAGEYSAAATAYEEFVKNRPLSSSAPYMLYKAARSYQLSSSGVGRDSAPLEKSLQFYDSFLEKYPDSYYSIAARKFRSEVAESLAKHEQRIMAFYKKRNRPDALAAREKQFEEKWNPILEKTSFSDEPKSHDAPKGVAPTSPEVQEAISQDLQETEKAATVSRVATKSTPKELTAFDTSGKTRILRVQCTTTGARGVFIYLDKRIDDSIVQSPSVFSSNKDKNLITVNIPNAIAKEESSSDCFETGDLTVTTEGKVQVRTAGDASVISLDNPPRVFVALR